MFYLEGEVTGTIHWHLSNPHPILEPSMDHQGSNADDSDAGDDAQVDPELGSNLEMGDNACILVILPSSLLILPFFQVIIQDITSSSGAPTNVNKERNSGKVLLSEFDNRKLALFAKRCARAATCLVSMCPEDPLFSWPTFTEEFEALVTEGRRPDFVVSLKQINDDPEHRDKLVRFVSETQSFLPE